MSISVPYRSFTIPPPPPAPPTNKVLKIRTRSTFPYTSLFRHLPRLPPMRCPSPGPAAVSEETDRGGMSGLSFSPFSCPAGPWANYHVCLLRRVGGGAGRRMAMRAQGQGRLLMAAGWWGELGKGTWGGQGSGIEHTHRDTTTTESQRQFPG